MPVLKEEVKWQIESDVRTLTAAQEILANKSRLSKAKAFAKKEAAKIAKVAGSNTVVKSKSSVTRKPTTKANKRNTTRRVTTKRK